MNDKINPPPEGKYRPEPTDDWLVNSLYLTSEEVLRQHGPHPFHVVTWHDKRVSPPARPPLTLMQRLLPWRRSKLTREEVWASKQLD